MPSTDHNHPALISLARAAARAGVSTETFGAHPPVPIVWVGRKRFFSSQAFAAWLESIAVREAS